MQDRPINEAPDNTKQVQVDAKPAEKATSKENKQPTDVMTKTADKAEKAEKAEQTLVTIEEKAEQSLVTIEEKAEQSIATAEATLEKTAVKVTIQTGVTLATAPIDAALTRAAVKAGSDKPSVPVEVAAEVKPELQVVAKPQLTTYQSVKHQYFPCIGQNIGSTFVRLTIMFGASQVIQNELEKHLGLNKKQAEDAALVLGSMVEGAMWAPITLAKQRTTIDATLTNYWNALFNPKFAPGDTIKAIYKGATLGALRNAAFMLPFVCIKTKAEDYFITENDDHKIIKKMGIGVTLGSSMALLGLPLDVLQKNIMNVPSYSIKEMLHKIIDNGGAKGLWAGGSKVPARMGIYGTGLMLAGLGAEEFVKHKVSSKAFTFFKEYRVTSMPASEMSEKYTNYLLKHS
jgi:hypothetical protein